MLVYIALDYGKKLVLPFDDGIALLKLFAGAKMLRASNYDDGFKTVELSPPEELPQLHVVPDDLEELIREGELLQVENMQKFLKERGVNIYL